MAQFNETIVLGAGTATPKMFDMLDATFNDLGVSNMGGLTVMDVRGEMKLVNWIGSAATTPAYETIRVGYNWFSQGIAGAGDGASTIPEPLLDGARESKWIQQWQLGGLEAGAPLVVSAPLLPLEESLVKGIHVRNMRKQPEADAKLGLVVSGGSTYETNTVALVVALQIMLALP